MHPLETDDVMEEREVLSPIWDDGLLAGRTPAEVVNHRVDRFRGEALTARLSTLAPEDQRLARGLYEWLYAIEAIAGALGEDPVARSQQLRSHLEAHPVGAQVRAMQGFGRATAARAADGLLAKVAHDVRGGPLTGLLMMLQSVGAGRGGPEDLLRVHSILAPARLKRLPYFVTQGSPRGPYRSLSWSLPVARA